MKTIMAHYMPNETFRFKWYILSNVDCTSTMDQETNCVKFQYCSPEKYSNFHEAYLAYSEFCLENALCYLPEKAYHVKVVCEQDWGDIPHFSEYYSSITKSCTDGCNDLEEDDIDGPLYLRDGPPPSLLQFTWSVYQRVSKSDGTQAEGDTHVQPITFYPNVSGVDVTSIDDNYILKDCSNRVFNSFTECRDDFETNPEYTKYESLKDHVVMLECKDVLWWG